LIGGRDAPEFHAERIWSSVMDDLTMQRQRVFVINQQ
jgi:hypothetical protein